MSDRAAGTTFFRTILTTVVGQAFVAAGYTLDDTPLQWIGGKFRYTKPLNDGSIGMIDYQALIYTETGYAAKMPSRFRVTLTHMTPTAASAITRTLSALVVTDFGVAILPDADYWWTFTDTHTLGQALAEAGHLVIGYGIPWLDGTLIPPSAG